MAQVSVTELRQNLQGCSARAQGGERIRITFRGKVIAELSAPSADAPAGRNLLLGSALKYERPLDPAADSEEWQVNR